MGRYSGLESGADCVQSNEFISSYSRRRIIILWGGNSSGCCCECVEGNGFSRHLRRGCHARKNCFLHPFLLEQKQKNRIAAKRARSVLRCGVSRTTLLSALSAAILLLVSRSSCMASPEDQWDYTSINIQTANAHAEDALSEGDPSRKSLDCTCRQHETQPVRHHPSKQQQQHQSQGGGARIFYLVLVHNVPTMEEAIPLFRALRDPRHSVVFHVDQKVYTLMEQAGFGNNTIGRESEVQENTEEDNHDTEEEAAKTAKELDEALRLQQALKALQTEIESCPCGSRVLLDSVHSVKWSHWSMNLPTLWGMKIATTHELFVNHWDVFVNLSGDTLPVYTPHTMAHMMGLFQAQNYNFVTSRSCETGLLPTSVYDFPSNWHKRQHYTNQDKDPPPLIRYSPPADAAGGGVFLSTKAQFLNVTIHFGSQWVVLQRDFVAHLVQELERPDSFPCQFRDYLLRKGKVMTDETFVPTVLMHTAPYNTTTLPRITADNTDETDDEKKEYQGSLIYHDDDKLLPFPLPPIYTLRYERMDEKYPSPLRDYYPTRPRYEVPHNMSTQLYQWKHNLQLPPEPHIWGPYYLGIYDLAAIRDSGALFLRKVSRHVDPNLNVLLPVDAPYQIPPIGWPTGGVQASVVPDWESEKHALMKLAYLKAKKKGVKIPKHIQEEFEEEIEGNEKEPDDHETARKSDSGEDTEGLSRHTELV